MSNKYFEKVKDGLIHDAGKLKISMVSVKDEGRMNGNRQISFSARK